MNRNLIKSIFLAFVFFSSTLYGQNDLVRFVCPLVGTDFHGHTYPGAIVPFGGVQLSPDTRLDGWDGCSAYHYSDNIIYGFSHTHLSGTGCSDYGDILVVPFMGTPSVINTEYCSTFSHTGEQVEPGYYKVLLDKNSILAELTCSPHVGVHRYTFPKEKGKKGIIIDLKHRDMVLNSAMRYHKNDNKIIGFRDSKAWNENQKINFSMMFSQPIDHVELYVDDKLVNSTEGISGKNCKAIVYFDENASQIVIKVAVSHAGLTLFDADRNQEEIADFDFDRIRKEAREAWNKELGKIIVKTDDIEQKKVFYTALYHCFTSPYLFTDLDGKYRGMDGLVYNTDKKHQVYTVFSLWDTYRALHPLLSLIDRKRTEDFIYTFKKHYEQGGQLPVWELSAYETMCMIGYHSISVIYDAYKKGILDSYSAYEKQQILDAMIASAEMPKLGRPEMEAYGCIPADMEHESVSKTLEYAYDDWCIAQFAKEALDKDDVYDRFMRRAQSYKNLMDSDGFMHARVNGGFLEPFDPREINNHYTEANCWQYSTYVPHDFNTYVDLIGGPETAERFLDSLFYGNSQMTGRDQSDVTGLIGQYAHGNEPSHHAAYLYNYVGKPWKTQELINRIIHTMYTSAPDGLCGNEDCGQMSAWYVLSAIGFYPVCPGSNEYIIGSPTFDEATVSLENGKSFIIRTKNRSKEACYIKSVKLNGDKYDKSYITFDDIRNGGVLEFVMSDKPNAKWGIGKDKQPESRIPSTITTVPVICSERQSFSDSLTFSIKLFNPSHKDKNYAKAENLYPAQTDMTYISITYPEKENDTSESAEKRTLYTGPVTLKSDAVVSAVSYNKKTGWSAPATARFYKFSQNMKLMLQSKYEDMYPAGGDDALIDGIRGNVNFRLGGWQGYCGTDFQATVDLQTEQDIHSVTAGFLQDTRAWIVFPTEMEVEVSDDNIHFRAFGTFVNTIAADNYEPQKEDFTVKNNAKARYIRIKAKTYGVLPSWHLGAGGNSHIFIDEIKVE